MLEQKTMKEKMEEAKKIYFMKDFRQFMRSLQGLTDEDITEPIPLIRDKIFKAEETDPIQMFDRIFKELSTDWNKSAPFPVNIEWHHFIIPGIIIKSLINLKYNFTDRDLEEAINRGEKFAGGSCGFAGSCGGAYSVGIVLSIIYKTNPLHDEKRSEIMNLVSDTLKDIAKYQRRCCKRSNYLALQNIIQHLRQIGFERIPYNSKIICQWSSMNKMCFGAKCVYFKGNNL